MESKGFSGTAQLLFFVCTLKIVQQPLRLWERNTALPLSPLTDALTATWAKSNPGNLCALSLGMQKGIKPPGILHQNFLTQWNFGKQKGRALYKERILITCMKPPAAFARRHSVTSSKCKKDQQVYWVYKTTVNQTCGLTLFSLWYLFALVLLSLTEKNAIPQLSRTWSWAGSAASLLKPWGSHKSSASILLLLSSSSSPMKCSNSVSPDKNFARTHSQRGFAASENPSPK